MRNLERRLRDLEAQAGPRQESLFEAVSRARIAAALRQRTGEPIPERPLVPPGPGAGALAVAVYEARLRALASRQKRGSTGEAPEKHHLQDTAQDTSAEQVPDEQVPR